MFVYDFVDYLNHVKMIMICVFVFGLCAIIILFLLLYMYFSSFSAYFIKKDRAGCIRPRC